VKFATVRIASQSFAAVVQDDRVHPFPPDFAVRDLVRLGRTEAVARGSAVVAESAGVTLSDVTLLAPLQPASVRDFVAFEEHVEGVRRSVDGATGVVAEWYEAPTFYFTNPHTIIGPDAAVAVPAGATRLDFELEVAVVVGRDGTDLSGEEAEEHIFGYTILNDWSARDLQQREMRVGLGPAKGKDFASTLGPWIVTADELADRHDEDGFLDLWCTTSVNGTEVGRDLLSNMSWTFPTLIAYASRSSRVVAGDVLGSGTCGNGGCLAELWGRRPDDAPPPLRPGDVVTLTVDGIGSVTNTVVAGRPAPALPPARRRDPAAARRRELSRP
jgi:2-keto-4-pentenoate hydratase/2-oxohepta-3-ene-1,7-dioic acid hydratase in catechol pathway